MDAEILFVGVPVREFPAAQAWYERFFARAPDVVAHDTEVLWQVTDRAWLYIVLDAERAGTASAAIAVPDIEEATSGLAGRGVSVGPIEPEGDAGRKATVQDPDGNTISILQVNAANGT